MSENPLSPALARGLTSVLLVLEGIRRDPRADPAEYREALEALDDFGGAVARRAPPELAPELGTRVDEARAALEAGEVEPARAALIRAGRAFDEWVRRHR